MQLCFTQGLYHCFNIFLLWCLFRFYLGAKIHQLLGNSLEAISHSARKPQGKFKNICNYCLRLCGESASDDVQMFASEWCPACYMRWKNDTSFKEKNIWKRFRRFNNIIFAV